MLIVQAATGYRFPTVSEATLKGIACQQLSLGEGIALSK
jgi:hypothetical protein